MSTALFINVEVNDSVAKDPALAAKLVEVCPVDCIPNDPGHVESQDQLMKKFEKLSAKK